MCCCKIRFVALGVGLGDWVFFDDRGGYILNGKVLIDSIRASLWSVYNLSCLYMIKWLVMMQSKGQF